jgi:hypothetical protein
MDFHGDLVTVAFDSAITRQARRRAGSRELAEDAIQDTIWNIAQQDVTKINNLPAYFRTALTRQISHRLTRTGPVLVEDIASVAELQAPWSDRTPPDSVEHEAEIRRLAQTVLNRIDIDPEELMAAVPRRSPDPRRYATAIFATARANFLMLLQGAVASADLNELLKSSYPRWFEPQLGPDVTDQRLSRGRYDVRMLLQRVLPREELI